MTETIEISPVPGLIAATPATRPSAAWTAWLEKWGEAKPDTRSPYWKAWSRHQSQEVMRQRYAVRPCKPRTPFAKMSPAQFFVTKVGMRVKEYVRKYNARPGGNQITPEIRNDLTAAVILKFLAQGIDITRSQGEVTVFIERFLWRYAGRELANLVNTVHITDYGMRKRATAYTDSIANRVILNTTADPLARAILKEEIGRLTDYQLEQVLRKNKI